MILTGLSGVIPHAGDEGEDIRVMICHEYRAFGVVVALKMMQLILLKPLTKDRQGRSDSCSGTACAI